MVKRHNQLLTIRLGRLISILAVTLMCSSGFAQSPAAKNKAKKLFVQGNKAFSDGRYSDAMASYRASYQLVERPSTLFNIATCRDRLGQSEQAYVDFEEFLSLADEGDAALKAKAEARLEQLREIVRPTVVVASQPIGATVFDDTTNAVLGRTPANLSLKIGPTTIRLEAPKHLPMVATVNATPGKPTHVLYSLEPMATVTITATPSLATIKQIGEPTKTSGRLETHLAPGKYRFAITHPDHHPREIEIEVASGQWVTKAVKLQPLVPPAPVNQPMPIVTQPADSGSPSLRYAGLAAGGLGVLAVVVGVTQGLSAQKSSDDAQKAAIDMGVWNPRAHSDAQDAETRMFVFYGVGAAALATGVTLYILGRGSSETAIAVAPAITTGEKTLSVVGRF